MTDIGIAVIIAAFNASDTIALAIKSALAEPEVTELIVVDDASSDNTSQVAIDAAESDNRFSLIVHETNKGPSKARNTAISKSSAPYISILDADDIILPGRFNALMLDNDWDLIADNIVFCESFENLVDLPRLQSADSDFAEHTVTLDFETFVSGNISRRGRKRGELGFIKPVIKRSFINQHKILYEEDCRLGEDFLLYSQCLLEGARFKLIGSCGYAALVRPNSLSGLHGLNELRVLWMHSKKIEKRASLDEKTKAVMKPYLSSVKRRLNHREVLEIRRTKGLFEGLKTCFMKPQTGLDIIFDKFGKDQNTDILPRLLFTKTDLERYRV